VYEVENKKITGRICAIHKESDGRYGVPKIHAQLLKEGVKVSIKRVQRLMKKAGIRSNIIKKYRPTANKTAELVYQAITTIQANLNDVKVFHTDRGKEFDNKLISEALETFGIQRSLSMKGCPYDNAVAEATFKVFKTEFANGAHFTSLEQLALELSDYVHWFNNIRIHGTLGYLTPVEFKQQPL